MAVYDWIGRIHFALFVLGGLGLVGAAITWGTPYVPILLGIGGLISIALGVLGWRDRPRAVVPERSAVMPTPAASPSVSVKATTKSKPRLIAKQQQLSQWRAERAVLLSRGDDLANELRLFDVEHASDRKIQGIYKRGTAFLKDVEDHEAKWWSGITLFNSGGLMAQLATMMTTPVPGPSWRAQLVARIEYETDWLRKHGPAPTANPVLQLDTI